MLEGTGQYTNIMPIQSVTETSFEQRSKSFKYILFKNLTSSQG